MAACMKKTVFREFAPYDLVEVYRRFGDAVSIALILEANVGKVLSDYETQHARKFS
jgi:hypothetical protein